MQARKVTEFGCCERAWQGPVTTLLLGVVRQSSAPNSMQAIMHANIYICMLSMFHTWWSAYTRQKEHHVQMAYPIICFVLCHLYIRVYYIVSYRYFVYIYILLDAGWFQWPYYQLELARDLPIVIVKGKNRYSNDLVIQWCVQYIRDPPLAGAKKCSVLEQMISPRSASI